MANEFTEATGNLYLSALIELGLVLFLLTFAHQWPRAGPDSCDGAAAGRRTAPDLAQVVNAFMLSAHRPLRADDRLGPFFYSWLPGVEWRQVSSLEFLYPASRPVGESGGGMANAILGTGSFCLVAAVRRSHRLAGRVYLAEFGGRTIPVYRPVYGGPAERRALDRDRHFRLRPGRHAHASLFDPGRRNRARDYGDPDPCATRRVSCGCAAIAARGRLRAGRNKWRMDRHGGVAGRLARNSDRAILRRGARGWRDGAAAVYRVRQPLSGVPGWKQPTSSLPVVIYTYATGPYEDWHRQAWAAGLVLAGLMLLTNIAARIPVAQGSARGHEMSRFSTDGRSHERTARRESGGPN